MLGGGWWKKCYPGFSSSAPQIAPAWRCGVGRVKLAAHTFGKRGDGNVGRVYMYSLVPLSYSVQVGRCRKGSERLPGTREIIHESQPNAEVLDQVFFFALSARSAFPRLRRPASSNLLPRRSVLARSSPRSSPTVSMAHVRPAMDIDDSILPPFADIQDESWRIGQSC